MKIKAILTVFISLLIGFVLGYLTCGQVKKHEWENRHKHSYHEMFVFRTLGVIAPTEVQKDTLLPIIEDYAEKTLKLKNNVSFEFDSLIRKMNDELKPHLTKEQFNKLSAEADRMNQRKDK
jgi:hypothetical protein